MHNAILNALQSAKKKKRIQQNKTDRMVQITKQKRVSKLNKEKEITLSMFPDFIEILPVKWWGVLSHE